MSRRPPLRLRDTCGTLILGIAFVILGTAFTAFPELLAHTALGFEQRGVLHHVWHYMVWISGFMLVAALVVRDRAVEITGLALAGLAVAWNLAAVITDSSVDLLALDLALRGIVVCAVGARLVELLFWGDR